MLDVFMSNSDQEPLVPNLNVHELLSLMLLGEKYIIRGCLFTLTWK